MPEHCHLLLWPSDLANPSRIMQRLEERTAKFILKTLRQNLQFAWCRRMLGRETLPLRCTIMRIFASGRGGSTT